MKTVVFVLTILLGAAPSYAAKWLRHADQRTTLPKDILKDRKSWAVDLEGGLRQVEGNTQSKLMHGGFSVYKTVDFSSYYLDINGLYSESSKKVSENHLNGALRWDRRCFEDPNWRFFVFNTHGFNEFTKLNYRTTLGSGIWYDFHGEDWVNRVSVAPSYFYEEFEGPLVNRELRVSLRDVGSWKLDEKSSVGYDFFYIPKANKIGDFQIFFAPFVQTEVYKKFLSIKVSLSLEHDSRPQSGVKRTDRAYLTSFVFSMGQ